MLSFSDIIGQDDVCRQLSRAAAEGSPSHAYLISGDEGSGKMMLAECFAAALQCTGTGERPCGSCIPCMQAESHNHPDIIYVTHEKAMIRVDDIRSQIVSDISIKPFSGSYKVYIINDADKMNEQAQNALLKTLEEPPEYAVIILLAVNTGAFLPTILSRCVKLETKPVQTAIIAGILTDRLSVPDYHARLCASFSCGSIGKAVKYASDEDFGLLRDRCIKLVTGLDRMTQADMIDLAEELGDESHRSQTGDLFALLRLWYHDVLVYKSTRNAGRLLFSEERSAIASDSARRSYEELHDLLEAIDTAENRIASNVFLTSTLELLLITMKTKRTQ